MKYDLNGLLHQLASGQSLSFLFFWGHRRHKDGKISKSCLSQWWEDGFQNDGITYKTAEHWMMAEKARLFQDEEALRAILEAPSPELAKKLGRKVRHYDEQRWEEARYEVVRQGNLLKFSQNPHLATFLANTGNRILVEASPYDTIWGIGMREDDPGIKDPANWQGLNLLGFALMEVRDKFQLNIH